MKTDSNEGAFACVALSSDGRKTWQNGLTKREYFAAMALQGILSNSGIHAMAKNNLKSGDDILEMHCSMAVDHADALIEELNKATNDTNKS